MSRFRKKIADLEACRPLTEPPLRYGEWLDHCFGRLEPVEAEGIDLFDQRLGGAIAATPGELAALMEVTFRRGGTDLARYSDEVVGNGLTYILDPCFSDYCYRVRVSDVPRERKANMAAALSSLYDDVLAKRCKPALGHRSEGDGTRLAYICYMLWDVTALAYWPADEAGGPYAQAVLGVLERALDSANDAVVESALHGIGHLGPDGWRQETVAAMLARRPGLRAELAAYARAAAGGCVQ